MYLKWASASCQATGGGSPPRMGFLALGREPVRARAVSFLSAIHILDFIDRYERAPFLEAVWENNLYC
ncbi:hypothetical protein [Nostoc sp.]|uniref:hypothetical protein n=1 Tax=Nostoc sp. TaxID=1180 RepID=UPI002FEF73D3